MGIFKEFKEFAIKGNMVDIAVGVIVGAAFNKVIDVLVKQVITPPLSLMTDGIQFSDRKIVLRDAIDASVASGGEAVEEVAINYGALLEALIDFFIIGFTIFLVVKFMNRFRAQAQDPKNKKVTTPKDIELLSNLTDLVKEQNELLKNNN
ncbi:large conductance mechanosensitive channel protein MscL [Zunongwangia sp. HRR-M8]|uniref:large conductance mechanosensitive channel protein MscL n=1 Tax=Zunongwangia sp. HRR-M8 TaxID=3015170 RepID=UPI0022DD91D5|nr:large conductance mechanosensitive channel protein MscL [Zunongwangia sp. HRR-M8]WBL20805.1 large conductance mechanosensitive channel protein MscL [Zunongwangia sp. HRR-M8]